MILVTGGTGTCGGEIVSHLAATGSPFRAMVRDPAKAAALKITGVEIVPGDFSKPQTFPAALKGIDQVMLVMGGSRQQVEYEKAFVEAAKNAGVRHIVKLSAMTADPNSRSTFVRWHGEVERFIEYSGVQWTFLRPTFFMQNLLGLAGMVKDGTIYQPAGDAKAGYVDTADIAAVAVEALTEPGHEGSIYEISGPELLSYHDIARVFSEVLGKPVKYQDIPPEVAKQKMLEIGIPEWTADGLNELMDQLRAGEFAKLTRVIEDVGKKDPVTLDAFITEHAGLFR